MERSIRIILFHNIMDRMPDPKVGYCDPGQPAQNSSRLGITTQMGNTTQKIGTAT